CGDGDGGYEDGDGMRVEPYWKRVAASGVDEGGMSTQWLEEGEADDGGGRSWPESGRIPVTASDN
ncbi:hypothetical protein Tco_1208905, partial [Tanacetum coccineum]